MRYQDHLNFWYDNFPGTSSRTTARRGATTGAEQPLVFGSGTNAILEDGSPAAPPGVDPFANMEQG